MPSIAKPVATHPSLQRNELGLTIRDYEGTMSTLCAGCGHDSITAAIIRALLGAVDAAAHDREAERHRLLVEDARPISSAARTASTPRTAAWPPSPPAPTPPTAS